jgi:hypothetical protein
VGQHSPVEYDEGDARGWRKMQGRAKEPPPVGSRPQHLPSHASRPVARGLRTPKCAGQNSPERYHVTPPECHPLLLSVDLRVSPEP